MTELSFADTTLQGRDGNTLAFTLIELSVVLVVVGLLVGGVLVGRDLIRAAAVRAEISQIEQYQSATNTFRDKYGGLPGDLPAVPASQFGFAARGTQPGMGNGDGVIAGFYNPTSVTCGWCQSGEPAAFWVDLSAAHLIDGGFNTASPTNMNSVFGQYIAPPGVPNNNSTTSPNLSNYFPQAKIGQNNYVLVWSGGYSGTDNTNYFSVTVVPTLYCWSSSYFTGTGGATPSWGITVAQAYSIDAKIDDGLPQSGRVMAIMPAQTFVWATSPVSATAAPYTTPTQATASSCFDNGGANGAAQQYSMTQNNGNGSNCALSIRFQ